MLFRSESHHEKTHLCTGCGLVFFEHPFTKKQLTVIKFMKHHRYIMYGDGKIYARLLTHFDSSERCSGCGILNRFGSLHLRFCPIEKCPRCFKQLVSCPCNNIPYDHKKAKGSFNWFGPQRRFYDDPVKTFTEFGNINSVPWLSKLYRNSQGKNMAENEPMTFTVPYIDEYHLDGNKLYKTDTNTGKTELRMEFPSLSEAAMVLKHLRNGEMIKIKQGVKRKKPDFVVPEPGPLESFFSIPTKFDSNPYQNVKEPAKRKKWIPIDINPLPPDLKDLYGAWFPGLKGKA